MKITNCPWELENIGRSTTEIVVEHEDIFCPSLFERKDCQYLVVKVPAGKMDYILGLQSAGFTQIESQFKLSKLTSSFNFDDVFIKSFAKKTEILKIQSNDELQSILDMMTPGMFSTDRISVDPSFGKEIGVKRYKNWVTAEYLSGNCNIVSIRYKGQLVGISMFRVNNSSCDVLLGGLFEQYQNVGLGFLTPLAPILYFRDKLSSVLKFETSVSSNNFPVIEFYNYLNYKIENIYCVFVKHRLQLGCRIQLY